jgi:hypothetical protein
MVILALVGKTFTYEHIADTTGVLSEVTPHYLAGGSHSSDGRILA